MQCVYQLVKALDRLMRHDVILCSCTQYVDDLDLDLDFMLHCHQQNDSLLRLEVM